MYHFYYNNSQLFWALPECPITPGVTRESQLAPGVNQVQLGREILCLYDLYELFTQRHFFSNKLYQG